MVGTQRMTKRITLKTKSQSSKSKGTRDFFTNLYEIVTMQQWKYPVNGQFGVKCSRQEEELHLGSSAIFITRSCYFNDKKEFLSITNLAPHLVFEITPNWHQNFFSINWMTRHPRSSGLPPTFRSGIWRCVFSSG